MLVRTPGALWQEIDGCIVGWLNQCKGIRGHSPFLFQVAIFWTHFPYQQFSQGIRTQKILAFLTQTWKFFGERKNYVMNYES